MEAGKPKVKAPTSSEGLLAVSSHGGRWKSKGVRERAGKGHICFYHKTPLMKMTSVHSRGLHDLINSLRSHFSTLLHYRSSF
jgi:hypothetical protein